MSIGKKLGSLAARLILAFVAVALLSSATLFAISFYDRKQADETSELRAIDQAQIDVMEELESQVAVVRGVVSALAANPILRDALLRKDRDAAAALSSEAFALTREGAGISTITLMTAPGIAFYRAHAPQNFGDDVTSRRRTVTEAVRDGRLSSGLEAGRDNMSVFATAPVKDGDKTMALIDSGISLAQPFAERIKRKLGVDVAFHIAEGDKFAPLAATRAGGSVLTPEELKRAIGGQNVLREITAGDRTLLVRAEKLVNKAGTNFGVTEIVSDITDRRAAAAAARLQQILGALAVMAVAIVLGVFIARRISKPILSLTVALDTIKDGKTDLDVPGTARGDEIGRMAKSVDVLRQALVEVERLRAEAEAHERQAERKRREEALALADSFERSVGSVVSALSQAASVLDDSSKGMSDTAAATAREAEALSGSTEQAATGVQTVAASAEELSASVREIAGRASSSAAKSGEAVEQARTATKTVESLVEVAARIGDVTKLINDIASQTNLLALNATIEAARAGEAGKGFAVVASEVKNLAGQTAKATEEIARQIAEIQGASDGAVVAIRGIAGTIDEISSIAAAIAAAVEEQGAATGEIAQTVQRVASDTAEVSRGVTGFSQSAAHTGDVASGVRKSAGDVAAQTERLRDDVKRFLDGVRAA
ncbi:MAG: HAMP domain-containing protein [Alphaproteobacteria bacterium]|nr:HAMP domain-containing protein [Alphaproteobacteria bacterium]